MQPPTPRHLAEHRLPWRLMLVAFGLTFAVLAALAASAAFVPDEPLVPSAGAPIPADTTLGPEPSGPPSSPAPSSSGEEPSSTSARPPDAGQVPLLARSPATAALQATPGTPRPAPADPPRPVAAPATDEPPPPEAPFSTLEATTTTLEPTPTLESTTTTLDPAATTTTAAATVLTTAAEAEATTTTTTTTAVVLAAAGEQAAGVLLAPLLALLYLSRGLLARPEGRHARPGRYRLLQGRSRRARRRPPARAKPRP